jgi:hypothetical protein
MSTQLSASGRIHVRDLVDRLVAHPIYSSINDESALRLFMRTHVFCVWDFQSLLKALQMSLTCVTLPWLPTRDREARRLINEIVLDEESDENPDGGYFSHFELYLDAMRACGADSSFIENLTGKLHRGDSFDDVLNNEQLPDGVKRFVGTTLDIARSGAPHRVAAAFTLGREDLIPEMFKQFVAQLSEDSPASWSLFLYYLTRHIETDGERHGPLSHALLSRLCGDDAQLWAEAEETARHSLEARLDLWDSVLANINGSSTTTNLN